MCSHQPEEDISEWVFECVLQYMRSPLWTTPVHGFIDEHCAMFDAKDEENKLEYTQTHDAFRVLIDGLLSSFLAELGVAEEVFMAALHKERAKMIETRENTKRDPIKDEQDDEEEEENLANDLLEFLLSLDDFQCFRVMMERKNIEMELEAMYEHVKYTKQRDQLMASLEEEEEEEEDAEERFLMEMAIHMSLGDEDVAMKRLEAEDAKMLQELVVSLALEQEKLLKQQQEEEEEERAQKAATTAVSQHVEELRAKRQENAEKAAAAATTTQQQPTVLRQQQQQLAPIGNHPSLTHQSFGASKKTVLPGISSSSSTVATAAVPEPSFGALVQQTKCNEVQQKDTSVISDEERERRAQYFRAQRDRIRQQRQSEREAELEEYKKAHGKKEDTPIVAAAADTHTTTNAAATVDDEATKSMRIALARRFKEDLVLETKRAADRTSATA